MESVQLAEPPSVLNAILRPINVGGVERVLSIMAGGMMVADGARRRDVGGLMAALIGGALLQRGLTGHCSVYLSMGRSTVEPTEVAPS